MTLQERFRQAFFEPEQAILSKNTGIEKKGREPKRPYSSMYLSGLKLGFSTNDLRTMPFMRLICFIDAINSEVPNGPREANQDDINRLLVM